MKTERRHELQQNELVLWVQENVTYLRTHAIKVIVTVLAIFLIILIYFSMSSWISSARGKAWTAFFSARDAKSAEKLATVVDNNKFKDYAANPWALQTLADMQLGNAANLIFRDKEQAFKQARMAKDNYEAILNNKATTPMLRLRTLFSLAKANEILLKPEEAKATYLKLVESAPKDKDGQPTGVLAAEAQRRADLMTSQASWYAWFASQDVKNYRPKPNPLLNPGDPSIGNPGSPSGTTPGVTLPGMTTPESNLVLPGLEGPFSGGTTPGDGSTVPLPGGTTPGTADPFDSGFGIPGPGTESPLPTDPTTPISPTE